MNGTPAIIERRNQRISTRLRRIQGQIVALERSLATESDFTVLLQRAAAARGAMSGLIADLIEERLRSLQVVAESNEARAEVAEMIDIVQMLSHLMFLATRRFANPRPHLNSASSHLASLVWILEAPCPAKEKYPLWTPLGRNRSSLKPPWG
jgi:DNA-binding FrmR family transcriptional regulator